MKNITELPATEKGSDQINVIVETPRGHRNKFKYDEQSGLFLLNKALPAGAVFPYDFGFIPSTQGEDGDPLDVLVLMDEPVFPGVLLRARLIGAIEAEQTEKGETVRNDRLIAVASVCADYQDVRELADLNQSLVAQIEHFFVSYNAIENKEFKPLARANAAAARKLLDVGIGK